MNAVKFTSSHTIFLVKLLIFSVMFLNFILFVECTISFKNSLSIPTSRKAMYLTIRLSHHSVIF